jgi:hypothetical protein
LLGRNSADLFTDPCFLAIDLGNDQLNLVINPVRSRWRGLALMANQRFPGIDLLLLSFVRSGVSVPFLDSGKRCDLERGADQLAVVHREIPVSRS